MHRPVAEVRGVLCGLQVGIPEAKLSARPDVADSGKYMKYVVGTDQAIFPSTLWIAQNDCASRLADPVNRPAIPDISA